MTRSEENRREHRTCLVSAGEAAAICVLSARVKCSGESD